MYFINKIKEKYNNQNIVIFVDMDGVITDYDFSNKLDFKNKRCIMTNINTLKEISKLENVLLCILSVCRKDFEIKIKNDWLDKNAPFFKFENRIILSKENNNLSSKELKCNFLNNYNRKNNKIIVIDDDNEILKYLSKNVKDIDLYQDSSIID